MKKIFLYVLLFKVLNLNAVYSLETAIDEDFISIDDNQQELISRSHFNELIDQAEYRENKNYILAQVQSEKGFNYFDGNMTHQYYQDSKRDPEGQKDSIIKYFMLTRYENQKTFRFFTSEYDPLVSKFFGANEGSLNDLLEIGTKLANEKRIAVAQDLLIRAWQKGSFLTQWKAYQGFEKLRFPDEPKDNIDLVYRKMLVGYHFFKDVFWR